jgi:hypothetical protein
MREVACYVSGVLHFCSDNKPLGVEETPLQVIFTVSSYDSSRVQTVFSYVIDLLFRAYIPLFGCVRLTTLPPSCAVVMKSGNLNFLEPSAPLQACNGTAVSVLHYSTTSWVLLVQNIFGWILNDSYITPTTLLSVSILLPRRIHWFAVYSRWPTHHSPGALIRHSLKPPPPRSFLDFLRCQNFMIIMSICCREQQKKINWILSILE